MGDTLAGTLRNHGLNEDFLGMDGQEILDQQTDKPNLDNSSLPLNGEGNSPLNDEQWEPPVPLDNRVLPLFKTNIFPDWLKRYVDGVAEETQTPKDAAAMAAISILSTIMGGKFVVKPNGTSWRETLGTYSVIALDPANRKSAVFSLFQKPISEFEKEERERLAPIISEEQTERKAIKKRIGELERQYSREKDEKEGQVLLNEIKSLEKEVDEELNPSTRYPRFFTSDVTPEKLAELMYENDERFSILSSEGAELFDMIAGRYSNKTNIDIYLKSYSGDNVTVDRVVSGREISLQNPTLTIGLFVQPSVIKELPNEFLNRGLIQRFLFFLPKSFIGYRKIKPEPIPINIKNDFKTNIRKMLDLDKQQKNDNESFQLNFDDDERNILTFDNEASEYLEQIQEEIEILLKNQDLNLGFKGWLGKLAGQIIRLSALLHIAYHVQKGKISSEINKSTLMKADSLRDYFIQHAEVAFGIIGENESLDDVKYVLGKINSEKFKGKTKIDYQEIWQLVKKRFKKSEILKDVLNILEEMNYVRNSMDGRKRVIHVNPYLQNKSPNSPNSNETQLHQGLALGNADSLRDPNNPNKSPNTLNRGTTRGEIGGLGVIRGNDSPDQTPCASEDKQLLGELGEGLREFKNNIPNVEDDGEDLVI